MRQSQLAGAGARLVMALKLGSALYASFKLDSGECSKNGCHFLDLDEAALRAQVAAFYGLHLT